MQKLVKKFYKAIGYKEVYQLRKFTEDQYRLISSTDIYPKAKSTLEIGCNYGRLVELFGNDGKFAVGTDKFQAWRTRKQQSAILGIYELSPERVAQLPEFDIICMLSVHHQLVTNYGDDYARSVISALVDKSKMGFFIEFAAISEKYGKAPDELFKNNDEKAVRAYAESWLDSLSTNFKAEYLGKVRELQKHEPYRYLYMIRK